MSEEGPVKLTEDTVSTGCYVVMVPGLILMLRVTGCPADLSPSPQRRTLCTGQLKRDFLDVCISPVFVLESFFFFFFFPPTGLHMCTFCRFCKKKDLIYCFPALFVIMYMINLCLMSCLVSHLAVR